MNTFPALVLSALLFGNAAQIPETRTHSRPAAEPVRVPDTPEGRRIQAFLTAIVRADAASIRAFVEANFAESARKEVPLDQRVDRIRGMAGNLGKLQLVRVLRADRGAAAFVAQAPKTGETLTITLDLEPGGALGIRGIRVEAGASGEAPDPPEKPKGSDAEVAASASEWLGERAAADEFSGVVLLARKGVPFFHRAYGFANRELSVANSLETKFNIASIGKLFTSAALHTLIRDGRLSLDDTVRKVLPDSKISGADRITVRQLVEMRSGLGDVFGDEYDATPKNRLRALPDYLALFEKKPLLFEPGAKREYSNAGYIVLGLMIEKLSGQGFHDFVREKVFAPAGMTDSGYFPLDEVTPGRATGYTRQSGPGSGPRRANLYTLPARGSSAGGGYSTAADLLKFATCLSNGTLSLADTPPGEKWRGSGGFAGGSPGVNTVLEIDSERSLVAIVLTNDDPPAATKVARTLRQWMGMGT
ncbi:MAG TPA: serine hydrolase domain-containing protein [Thermoanaerobaculia bacterium]|nr:serine hydrolase domain-containing protein [Thermoanaerobaculia bacterium]